ncbi:zinc finger protein 729-like isoform X2 [Aricia agestis]|nr:zinc finger protein 729-like isoform X2 [Aricia agestis]XP_041970291.1 zinc finger protein 729-like isoform X2 [Aricia agestis]
MLQQMSSSPGAQFGEVASRARPAEGRACGDASSDASSDTPEEVDLPECKIKRNYNCTKCTFYTQNPRAFLVHSRDVHFEKLKIYDCPHCVYASRHHQKLTRHIKMVHEATSSKEQQTPTAGVVVEASPSRPQEKIEDLLEEVEEDEDAMDVDECAEESMERIAEGEPSGADDGSKGRGGYYSCGKCNYVTHIRSRYTKHVKYHSMPMIKCTMCEFRTPYKWNLDRHMKNHGGSGSFHCSMCNFTADIKQSLTVHEMNHHTHPVGQATTRRRNRVGASDMSADPDARDASTLIVQEDGSGDSSQGASDMGLQYTQNDREMTGCQSDSNEASTSENMISKDDSQLSLGSNANLDDSKNQKESKKAPRPIPQLIPLTASTPNQKSREPSGEPPAKKFKENPVLDSSTQPIVTKKTDNLPKEVNFTQASSAPKDTVSRKKNESFFDRLKERLLTETGKDGLICKNCGFESKCLSEQSVHEKTCLPLSNRSQLNTSGSNLGSTRCQNCRHRCKSSADLVVHMQTCGSNQKPSAEIKPEPQIPEVNGVTNSSGEKDAEPHPMENVVFVWNNITQNKFETPLDIRINDDSTLPDHKTYESEIVDDNESMNLSPSQATGRKVFKCPHCMFWASTASRFHVHIVGHLNKKPFECSSCKYKSNWRWDITKHIKLKSVRDPEHAEAKVLMTDETGRRNYSKYNRFMAIAICENDQYQFHYLDQNAATNTEIDDESLNDENTNSPYYDIQPLNLQTLSMDAKFEADNRLDGKKPKKTLWKCKKCNYKDTSREALLEHVKEHSKPEEPEDKNKKLENVVDPADLAYRCGHCNQLSNWKHVIQRHCRLKHDGIIKVITTVKAKPDPNAAPSEPNVESCIKCPFKSSDKNLILMHQRQHQPSPHSMFKCSLCPFFVKDEVELAQHLTLHGVTEPEEFNVSKEFNMFKAASESPAPEQMTPVSVTPGTKRHKCNECPYETNSKSQYMYHEQFHRISADTPYKCPECNYSVSKRHLLHQHMRVHGIVCKKFDTEAEVGSPYPPPYRPEIEDNDESYSNLDDIPYVWVSAKNEFHKMFKCRYCSYVNSQKSKIPNHEDIHCIKLANNDVTFYKCLECKYTCDGKSKLTEHSKSHGEIYGRIYCPVDLDVPDEEQIAKLREVIEKGGEAADVDDNQKDGYGNDRVLFFCQRCPARFFDKLELQRHDKLHNFNLSYAYKCKSCEFSVPKESALNCHNFVHTDEYNTKSKMLKSMHRIHPMHPDPQLQVVHCPLTSGIIWVTANPDKKNESHAKKPEARNPPKQYNCKECPAKFFKNSALSYHMGLHGGDGEFKCKSCSYAVKNIGNLAKHELLHDIANKPQQNADGYDSGDDVDYKIPLSGTDLFQRKTEAQKRVLTDKDKLVKPNDHFPPVLQADPQFGYLMHGNPEFIYPTYLKNGRQKEKRYKCHKCPSAFEKREQYKIHLSLHGSKQRYKCELCDYSVKYYANYVQHMRKHQMNDEAQAERKKIINGYSEAEAENQDAKQEDDSDNIKLAIKTMPKRPPKTDFQQFSISDQQTLRLLQRRRSIENSMKENTDTSPAKERKLHMCLLCPYTNQRQDALCNHSRRHDENDISRAVGNQKCCYCNLVVVQSHFLREHLKTHFMYQKHLNPECYIANQNVSFTIKKIAAEDEKPSADVVTDLKLDIKDVEEVTNDEKIFVKLATGELWEPEAS